MKLYFVRHGESEANTRHVISNRESPFGLTPRGRQQAEALAEKLGDVSFHAIFSSPILRARQTAEILSSSPGIPYRVTDALREYDCGILEERSDEESWKCHRQYFEDWTLRGDHSSKPEGGECFLEIRDRFLPFIESLKYGDDKNILLVGHGGLFHLMMPLILTNIDNGFVSSHGLGNTDCVVAETHSGEFVCTRWGELEF